MKHIFLQSYEEQEANHKMEVANKINSLTNKEFDCHLVTCGNCGNILNQTLHQDPQEWLITCPICSIADEPCHFPDLFH